MVSQTFREYLKKKLLSYIGVNRYPNLDITNFQNSVLKMANE